MQFLQPSSYPNVARFVRGELPKVATKSRVLEALMKFGQLSREAARRAVGSGPKPRLTVAELGTGVYGHYPGSGDTIQLNEVIARQYEQLITLGYQPYGRSADWDRLLLRGSRMLEAIILHEVVHWHDMQHDFETSDRYARRGRDWGHEFEIRAYGRVVSTEDIDGWMGWRVVKKGGRTYGIPFDGEAGYPPRMPPSSTGAGGRGLMDLGRSRRRK